MKLKTFKTFDFLVGRIYEFDLLSADRKSAQLLEVSEEDYRNGKYDEYTVLTVKPIARPVGNDSPNGFAVEAGYSLLLEAPEEMNVKNSTETEEGVEEVVNKDNN